MIKEIKAIIVEDVETYLNTIEKLVEQAANHVKIVGKSTTLSGAKNLILSMKPDLVLLDIQFELEGKTAFDMLGELAEVNKLDFDIIFITAHQEARYYAEAFHFNARHFIEKPIDIEKLKEALCRVNKTEKQTDWQPLISKLGEIHKKIHSADSANRIVVDGNMFSELVIVTEIVMIEASGRYSTIFLTGGRKIVSCRNLGEYEKMLTNSGIFIRIHKNRIVNYNMVKRYSKKERLIELFEPFGKHYASKDRFKEFVGWISQRFI
jgi:two-component system LytT family response regulator